MTHEAARLILPRKRSRAVRLPALTVVMTFAIAVAAEAFSPMPASVIHSLEDQNCAPALTIGLTSANKANADAWLQLVKNDGAAACFIR